MNAPVEVHFHGIQKSDAIEERVREKVAKLAKQFDRMTSCRVGIEAPQRTPHKPSVFQIKIEIGVPRRRPIVVSHERKGSHANEELSLAIRDAFAAAERKIESAETQISSRARLERGRRRPRRLLNGADESD
jgi:ribosome-associated translation inhibitor RaiA